MLWAGALFSSNAGPTGLLCAMRDSSNAMGRMALWNRRARACIRTAQTTFAFLLSLVFGVGRLVLRNSLTCAFSVCWRRPKKIASQFQSPPIIMISNHRHPVLSPCRLDGQGDKSCTPVMRRSFP